MPNVLRVVITIAVVALLTSCAVRERYTSLDLDLLPCESGSSTRFFQSIEYQANGDLRYPAQIDGIVARFGQHRPITDVVVFVHGWSKTPASAEDDYQDFLCRLHGKLRNTIQNEKQNDGLLVVGVFWPSTITNRASEPLLMKPVSYYRIRDRADEIAESGLSSLLGLIGRLSKEQSSPLPIRIQLIGHSFGARMVVGALEAMNRDGSLAAFLESADATNIVLMNAAVAPDRFRWIPDALANFRRKHGPPSTNGDRESYLFNVHSLNDAATRRLFPLASIFNDDPAVCAAGACGVPEFGTITLDDAGLPGTDYEPARICGANRIDAWNVDATAIVFGHTDIYKGRIAALLANLTYDQTTRNGLKYPAVDVDTCR